MVTLKSAAELERMREAGRVVAQSLDAVVAAARPGVRLRELDEIAAKRIRDAGAAPSFLDYQPPFAPTPYPGVLCASVNDVVVHGIPDDTTLREGDVLSVDCGAEMAGYHRDAAVTVAVGEADTAALELMAATERALWAAIDAFVPDGRLSDLSHAVESVGRAAGYGIPHSNGGHGIGTRMHEDPHLPNIGRPGRGMRLREGLVLAIEPMFLEGGDDCDRLLPDGWSIASADGSRAAHFEHSVALTDDGPIVLTTR